MKLPAIGPELDDEQGPLSDSDAPEDATPAVNTVLVVDDDDNFHHLIERTLAGEGFNLVRAMGGQEGLRLAKELSQIGRRTRHPRKPTPKRKVFRGFMAICKGSECAERYPVFEGLLRPAPRKRLGALIRR